MSKKIFEQNNKTIKSAIANFKKSVSEGFQKGMENLLDYAVQYALDSHDEGHQQHLQQGDSYGWALYHNKKLVSYKIFSQVAKRNNALYSELKNVEIPSPKCWCGVVMAGMDPISYFSADYELNILALTKEEIQANFYSYFKPYMKNGT